MYKIDKKRIFWKDFEDETVLVNIEKGLYYSLDKSAKRIWGMIIEKADKENIIERVIDEYDVKENVAKADVGNFLRMLEKEKLIEPRN